MTIRTLTQAPRQEMADALEEFECHFTYPLGPGRSFRISHGRDYPRFFRAIDADSAASFVAIGAAGAILGTLGVAVRPVQFPGGDCRLAAYLGDLKTAPGAHRGRTLLRLAAEATHWSESHGAVAAYGVVMDGTPFAPSGYTGRLGIHGFDRLSRVRVLRLSAESSAVPDGAFESEAAEVEACFRRLGGGGFTPLGGNPEIRSASRPAALLAPDHSACGILEDTRLAKRLFVDEDQEMMAAHLSKFAYANPRAGVRLIREALARCAQRALAPAMFVAVPECDASSFVALLGDASGMVEAGGTIYGTQFEPSDDPWNISTSEI